MLIAEINQAHEELKQAQQNFDNADPEFIDVAIYNLKAAEIKKEKLFGMGMKELRDGQAEAGL